MKNGTSTSEFALSLVAMVAGLAAFVLGALLGDTHQATQLAGLVVSGLSGLGYTWSRTAVKRADSASRAVLGASSPAGSSDVADPS